MATVEDQVRKFIVENFLFGDETREVAPSTSLIENDLVDSTGILELVAFIEERFDFTVADREIIPDNLDSIERISAYVIARAGENAASAKAA